MAITNHERVGKALELLKAGLGPVVEREFKNAYRDRAAAEVGRFMCDDRLNAKRPVAEWRAQPFWRNLEYATSRCSLATWWPAGSSGPGVAVLMGWAGGKSAKALSGLSSRNIIGEIRRSI